MARRYYSSTYGPTALTAGINNSATALTAASVAGAPSQTPWTAVIDRGTASEELVEVTAAVGTTLTVVRALDGSTAKNHSAAATFEHVVSARDFDEANAHLNSTANVHPQYALATATKTVRVAHTFTVSGEVRVAVGDEFYIPGFFIPSPAGQVVDVAAVRYKIRSGTSVTFSIQQASGNLTGLAGLTATTTATTTDPTDVVLSADGEVNLVVTAVSGSPKNLSVTLYVDYTV